MLSWLKEGLGLWAVIRHGILMGFGKAYAVEPVARIQKVLVKLIPDGDG